MSWMLTLPDTGSRLPQASHRMDSTASKRSGSVKKRKNKKRARSPQQTVTIVVRILATLGSVLAAHECSSEEVFAL